MIELSILEINQIEVRAIVPIIQQSEWKVGNQWRVCRGLLSRAWHARNDRRGIAYWMAAACTHPRRQGRPWP
jgi:hypothetical protein